MNIDELRTRAETILKDQSLPDQEKLGQVTDLLHELQVYQVELELQNDELKKAQGTIEGLRQQYFELYHFAPIGYFVLDSRSSIKDLNLTACEMLGRDKRYLIGKALINYCSVDFRYDFQEMLDEAFKTDDRQQLDAVFKSNAAPDQKIHVHITAQRDNTLYRSQCLVAMTDISQRVEAEEQLAYSEERFRRAVIDAPEPIIIHAEDGEVILVSRAWTEYTGYGLQDIPTTRAWLAKAYGQDADQVEKELYRLFQLQQRKQESEHTINTREGQPRHWIFSSAYLGTMPDGRQLAMSMARDITERKRAENDLRQLTLTLEQRVAERTHQLQTEIEERKQIEQRLRESELFLQSVIDGQPASMAVLDANGVIIAVNAKWKAQAKHAHHQDLLRHEVGTHYIEVVQHSQIAPLADLISRVSQGQQDLAQYEYEIVVDGESIWYEVTVSRLQQGSETNVIVSHTDITTRKRLEIEIQRNLERERELNQMKTRFVSMVSHEFRNPLASILMNIELLTHYDDRLDAEQRQAKFQTVARHVQRLSKLLEEVSYINKSEVIGYELQLTHQDLFATLQEIMTSVQSSLVKEVHTTFENPQPLMGLFDDHLIDKIFSNLFSNAIKYSHDGGQVIVSLYQMGDEVLVTIEDDGIGIPSEDQPHIFYEPFHRGSNTQNIAGTGLGLTIVRQSVEQHGGRVGFRTKNPQGTVFWVRLPYTSL